MASRGNNTNSKKPVACAEGKNGKNDVRFRSQFRKTELCFFWRKGHCANGDRCSFAHGSNEIQEAPDLTKTSLCKRWLKFKCQLASTECPFAHGPHELRATQAYTLKPRPRERAQEPEVPGPCWGRVGQRDQKDAGADAAWESETESTASPGSSPMSAVATETLMELMGDEPDVVATAYPLPHYPIAFGHALPPLPALAEAACSAPAAPPSLSTAAWGSPVEVVDSPWDFAGTVESLRSRLSNGELRSVLIQAMPVQYED